MLNSPYQSPHEKPVCVQDLQELVTAKIQSKVAVLPLRITFRGAAQGPAPLIEHKVLSTLTSAALYQMP